MSLVNKSRKAILMFVRALLRAWRAVLRRATGKSELARILRKALIAENDGFSAELVRAVARSIASSSSTESPGVKGAVFGKHRFDVAEVARALSESEGISEEDKPSLVWCLQILAFVNAVHEKTSNLQRTKYDPSDSAHAALLEALWNSLQPEARRVDWSPLGFQNGQRPESDFRGMGLLGLHQLVFFAESRNREARQVLADSTNPKRYFPFAAAGINITAFTTAMLEQRRLDTCLYEAIVKHMPAGELPEDTGVLVEAGVAAFNRIYGDEYVEFSRFWHESDPASTMAFPGIFGTIKQRSNSRFPPLLGSFDS
ncbi:unnamed protein product [Hapterophycus canaliculatus]